ncbi:hypothetical protein [Corynebacterium hadale]|uniref:hypothetical protein n=1 Tax=Corynebacterium hadale TaxID=2026255 RepID=UPI00105676F0|nr:hypothetical protein [Corynebacterium hadale]
MHARRWATTVLLVSASLALAACGGGGGEPGADGTTSATSATAEAVTSDAPSAESEAPDTSAAEAEQADLYTVVDPERFLLGTAYVIGGDGDRWFHDCFIKTAELNSESDSGTYCHADFADPVPPTEEDYGVPNPPAPNMINWDEDGGRFSTAYSPGAELHPGTQRLRQGEQVTVDGLTVTHLHGGGYRVTKGDATFEMHDGVYTTTDPGSPAEAEAAGGAAGNVCGTVESSMGGSYQIVALEDGTTCDSALAAMRGYVDAYRNGAVEGQAGFWTAPNGWGCANGWFLPGDEQIRANAKNTCSASDRAGNPAQEGSGAVVALRPDDVARF